MKKTVILSFFFLSFGFTYGQSVDDPFPQKKMCKDLKVFKNIRLKANSGLYKYRSKEEIDSIYDWAKTEITHSKTYLDFYNILSQLTDFEGSLHNAPPFLKNTIQIFGRKPRDTSPFQSSGLMASGGSITKTKKSP